MVIPVGMLTLSVVGCLGIMYLLWTKALLITDKRQELIVKRVIILIYKGVRYRPELGANLVSNTLALQVLLEMAVGNVTYRQEEDGKYLPMTTNM